MAENIMLVLAKAMAKGALNPNSLTGLERFMLAQMTIPDRVPTFLAATNVEPSLIDKAYDYKRLSQSAEANLELFTKVKQRFQFDVVSVPTWLGLMLTGTAELGVQFQIEEERVPYACDHPIHGIEDVKKLKPFTEPAGYFKMTLDINREAQRRFPDTMVTFSNDGPWDLAMLLRGDKQLPTDFRIYKDYTEAKDPLRKEKIRKHGDPDLWPAIMEATTQISIQIFTLAKKHGISMLGAAVVDQFATKPVLSTDDFIKYVLPYSHRVWKALEGKVGMGYFVNSPKELEELLSHPILGKCLEMSGFTNYIFPTTPDGVTLPDYDEPMLALTKKKNRTYNYIVHAKFIRDATGQQLEDVVKRICQMATQTRTRLMISVGAIAPGTDLQKIDALLNSIHTYGRYSR
jgi:uroporphyrinogen-III decarboxylase